MNIFMQPKITQKHSKLCVFSQETSETPFFSLIAAQRELHLSKKGQRKNLAQAIYYKDTPKGTHQRAHSKMFHLGMLAGQTHSVKFSI